MSERIESCGNCRFARGATDKRAIGVECRRNPPQAGGKTLWPVVTILDWCGEWEDRVTGEREMIRPKPPAPDAEPLIETARRVIAEHSDTLRALKDR